jgi:hypothetical protein
MADAEQALQQLLEQEGQRLYADGAAITENGRQRHGAATLLPYFPRAASERKSALIRSTKTPATVSDTAR